MTDREKLVELLAQACEWGDRCIGCKNNLPIAETCREERFGKVADHLLANGVTVQNWRDAKTDPPTQDGQYLVFICCEQGEWIETDEFDTVSKIWRSVNGYHENATEFVTHWMPKLGKPPKGDNSHE